MPDIESKREREKKDGMAAAWHGVVHVGQSVAALLVASRWRKGAGGGGGGAVVEAADVPLLR